MPANRPFVLTIAGFDPSGGAGILADVKTFEQHRVQGLAINTGNTLQTENVFYEMQWTALDFVLRSIETLFLNYTIEAVKIGIVPSLDYLKNILWAIQSFSPGTKIIWDTVLKSSTEFSFLAVENQLDLIEILNQVHLITPNYEEILQLSPLENSAEQIATRLSGYCDVLLKGGHNTTEPGTDYLYSRTEKTQLLPGCTGVFGKHGSGCVLSAAITANIALGHSFETSCKKAKTYVEKYLNSNLSLIGYHHVY
ncbi:hydroxymethylpyrimidine/phosphomethylpyrimidine kinase [Flavobacterium humi]|uniref:hydroxymethylpyrimidine kinase n=1 Tax=Flavobacterium humi TaxID=2562683 RepID=A0A4Z0L495_9FLAO|nr:hydroxymethylpyrimidine/phosphomethylpyrimidine kinase [Flavobacterium humi]TGD57277.1 hydroxymethylpyrimidine/phosphomethylpyrimidine kinase [Flavobacterium humi]